MTQETENVALLIIASSGAARSMAFDALEEAKRGDFATADNLMHDAREAGLQAHRAQTDLLTSVARGQDIRVDVLLAHAQDHLMTSILAQELIAQMIDLYRRLENEHSSRLEAGDD